MKTAKYVPTTKLIVVPNRWCAEAVCDGLRNDMKLVKCHLMTEKLVGDDFTYAVYTDDKLSVSRANVIKIYLQGMESGLRAAGLWSWIDK